MFTLSEALVARLSPETVERIVREILSEVAPVASTAPAAPAPVEPGKRPAYHIPAIGDLVHITKVYPWQTGLTENDIGKAFEVLGGTCISQPAPDPGSENVGSEHWASRCYPAVVLRTGIIGDGDHIATIDQIRPA